MKTNYHMQLIHAQRVGASWPTVARLAFLEAWQGWHIARQMLRIANRHNGNKAQAMKTLNKQAALMRYRYNILKRV